MYRYFDKSLQTVQIQVRISEHFTIQAVTVNRHKFENKKKNNKKNSEWTESFKEVIMFLGRYTSNTHWF